MALEQSPDARFGVDVSARSEHASPRACEEVSRGAGTSAKDERNRNAAGREREDTRRTGIFLVVWTAGLEEDLDSVEGCDGSLCDAACCASERASGRANERARVGGQSCA